MLIRARVIAAAAAATVLAAGGVTDTAAAAAASTLVTGGYVSIALKATTLHAIHDRGIALKPISPATIKKSVLRLPTKSGKANPPNYTTDQAGGFSFDKGAKTIRITGIVINTTTQRASAKVTGHGRIVIFVLGEPTGGNGGPGKVEYGGYSVTMSGALIRALDGAFSVPVFSHHPNFGTGSTTVTFKV